MVIYTDGRGVHHSDLILLAPCVGGVQYCPWDVLIVALVLLPLRAMKELPLT